LLLNCTTLSNEAADSGDCLVPIASLKRLDYVTVPLEEVAEFARQRKIVEMVRPHTSSSDDVIPLPRVVAFDSGEQIRATVLAAKVGSDAELYCFQTPAEWPEPSREFFDRNAERHKGT
jgi:hypothetical protein